MPPDNAVVKRHAKMLFDLERTIPLLKAIQKKVGPGDVVVDVGCGLGVLSLAAVRAGAKRVYAIDVDGEAIDFGRRQAKKLGMEKKIVWLNDHSFNIDLAEKADLLIQETIGPLAFDENFLPTLVDAKKRFLKKNGRMIPEAIALWGAPAIRNKKLLQKPVELLQIKTESPSPFPLPRGERVRERVKVHIEKTWKIKERATGILLWPKIVWAQGFVTDCSPFKPATHWGQTLLPGKGSQLTLKFEPDSKDPLHYTEVLWKLKRG